jgi:hypothetical protein
LIARRLISSAAYYDAKQCEYFSHRNALPSNRRLGMKKVHKALIAASAAFMIVSMWGVAPSQAQNCNELRLACEHKDQLGEQGQGNCQRFREQCERQESRQAMCRRLRFECLHKDRLGLEGEGVCRQYREACR